MGEELKPCPYRKCSECKEHCNEQQKAERSKEGRREAKQLIYNRQADLADKANEIGMLFSQMEKEIEDINNEIILGYLFDLLYEKGIRKHEEKSLIEGLIDEEYSKYLIKMITLVDGWTPEDVSGKFGMMARDLAQKLIERAKNRQRNRA